MDAITGLDDSAFRARAASGEWTAAEVLAHLLATERILADRAHVVLAQDNPFFASMTDEERSEHAGSAQRKPVPQIVHGLLAQRRDVLRLLEPLTAQQLARPYRHERRGDLTEASLFARMAEHESEHAGQIVLLRSAGKPSP